MEQFKSQIDEVETEIRTWRAADGGLTMSASDHLALAASIRDRVDRQDIAWLMACDPFQGDTGAGSDLLEIGNMAGHMLAEVAIQRSGILIRSQHPGSLHGWRDYVIADNHGLLILRRSHAGRLVDITDSDAAPNPLAYIDIRARLVDKITSASGKGLLIAAAAMGIGID